MERNNLLKKLVNIPSEYPYEQQIGEYILQILDRQGISLKKQYIDKSRFNILAEKGTGDTSILLYAHLDTVGIVEGWKTDPHKLTIIDKKAYGLGAWDMKAGLVANIYAFLHTKLKNIKVKLALCVDEEYISTGGHMLISSPFIKDVTCVISTEPSFQYGLQGIVTGRIGRAVYDGCITTKSTHFAFYEPGYDINIVYADLLHQIQRLYKKSGDKKQFIFVRSVKSQVTGMSLPEKIMFELDSAVLPPHTHASIMRSLQAIATKLEKKYRSRFAISVQFHKRQTPFLEPYEIDKKNAYLTQLKESVTMITKKKAVPYFRSSVADENIFGAYGIPTLGIGPIGGNAHSANEWVDLNSLSKLTDILMHFISATDEL